MPNGATLSTWRGEGSYISSNTLRKALRYISSGFGGWGEDINRRRKEKKGRKPALFLRPCQAISIASCGHLDEELEIEQLRKEQVPKAHPMLDFSRPFVMKSETSNSSNRAKMSPQQRGSGVEIVLFKPCALTMVQGECP
uniref:TPX2 C-terminal domain-containing protein n=1 Tax=Oryza brachyantha TaxID=4533 RepID=J3M616_ORYBR